MEQEQGGRAFAAAPLVLAQQYIGALSLASLQPDAFTG